MNREGSKSYTFLSRELEAHFGTSTMGGGKEFDATRLPALLAELQTAFADRATFDNFFLPFAQRLCEAKTFNLHDIWNAEMYHEKGDTLREKLAAFKAAREGGDAALYEFSEKSESVCYKSGEAIVLYPCEAHLPNRVVNEPMKIKKAILKVALTLAK